MSRHHVAIAITWLAAGPFATAADPDPRAAVNKFYAEQSKSSVNSQTRQSPTSDAPSVRPLKALGSPSAADRAAAARFLHQLLALSLEDEVLGKAPVKPTPFWGGRPDLLTRALRAQIAYNLTTCDLPAEAIPLLKWYFDEEPTAESLGHVVAALGKLDAAEAAALRQELVTRPHPNSVVVAAVLEQIGGRKAALPAAELLRLCHHHRPQIRDAARALNEQLGGKRPGPFDPRDALRSQSVTALLGDLLKLMPDLPDSKTEFVTVTVRHLSANGAELGKRHESGFLLRHQNGVVEIATLHGRFRVYRDKEKLRGATTEVTVNASDLTDEVKKVVAARTGQTSKDQLFERGTLTGQFRGSGATPVEFWLGGWLYRAGRDAEAAAVLVPAIESLPTDAHLLEHCRHAFGELAGHRMLVAFVGDRDYPAAIRHAGQILMLYPRTQFHLYARELADQLPKRAADFRELALPTAAQWGILKQIFARDQQIDLLCERLRLLNCYQRGQPRGIDLLGPQYAEPCGLSEVAAWGQGKGKTELINPYLELAGRDSPRKEGEQPTGMDLTVKDIPRLSEYLRDDWCMPTVSFWRDFHPSRTLHHTRAYVFRLINRAAKQEICRADGWEQATPAEIEEEIDRINEWAGAPRRKPQPAEGERSGQPPLRWRGIVLLSVGAVLVRLWPRRRRPTRASATITPDKESLFPLSVKRFPTSQVEGDR